MKTKQTKPKPTLKQLVSAAHKAGAKVQISLGPKPASTKPCTCKLCLFSREFERIVSKLPRKDRKLMEQFYELHVNESEELSMFRAHSPVEQKFRSGVESIEQQLKWMMEVSEVSKPCKEWMGCDWHHAGAAFGLKIAHRSLRNLLSQDS